MGRFVHILSSSDIMETKDYSAQQFLAQNANEVVSEGGKDARCIKQLVKHEQEVVGYVLSDGKQVSVEEAINLAKQNQLQHVGVSTSKTGTEYIRSLADADGSNNLGNLPSITI